MGGQPVNLPKSRSDGFTDYRWILVFQSTVIAPADSHNGCEIFGEKQKNLSFKEKRTSSCCLPPNNIFFPPCFFESPETGDTADHRPPRLQATAWQRVLDLLEAAEAKTDDKRVVGVWSRGPLGGPLFFFGLVGRGWKTNPCRMLFWDNLISLWLVKLSGWTLTNQDFMGCHESCDHYTNPCRIFYKIVTGGSPDININSILFLQSHLDACWTWSLIL